MHGGLVQRNRQRLAVAAAAVTAVWVATSSASEPKDNPHADVDHAMARQYAQARIHPALGRMLSVGGQETAVKAWVLFRDKGVESPDSLNAALRALERTYDRRAVRRRTHRRTRPGLFDQADLPVSPGYIEAVRQTGANVRVISKWVNGVSVLATESQLLAIGQFPFVRLMQPVRYGRSIRPIGVRQIPASDAVPRGFYGQSEAQLTQINLLALHAAGFTGAGVVLGVLDTGFQRSHAAFNDPSHPLVVETEWDFINDDADTSIEPGDSETQHSHGTYILGTIGAYAPSELVGGAYDATFILCKTEDVTGEYPAEEDNYVAGLEFIEAQGGDVATASLVYSDWYTQADFDGLTAVTTLAVNTATANGLFCCNAAGNGGHDANPSTARLGAPADAFQVITVGAVDETGAMASFSSDGPTADGRVKPEVLARGIDTRTVSAFSDTDYAGVGGTSASTPLVAAAVACLVQAHPEWTVDQMRSYLFHTADYYVANQAFDPFFVEGYGILDAFAAAQADCNANGIDDADELAAGSSPDCNGNALPDDCDIAYGTSSDQDQNGVPDECQPPIPTLSRWAAVSMMLLLLVTGTQIFRPRQSLSPVSEGP